MQHAISLQELSVRHERFAQLLAAGLEPGDAYVKAGVRLSHRL
jgi:hypothetical protein